MKIIRVENCYECPKINNGLMVFGIKRCGITGRVIDNNLIPKECPLEDEKLRYVAYNEIEGFKVIEEYDCPIHGKLGGIDECPLC